MEQIHTNNNNNGSLNSEDNAVHKHRDRSGETHNLFTASKFLKQRNPSGIPNGSQTDPDVSRSCPQLQHNNLDLPISNVKTFDFFLAVPYTPKSALKEPTIIAEENGLIANSPERNATSLPGYHSKSRAERGKYNDISTQPNLKYSVNSLVGGQRYIDWDISTIPKDFLCPITNKLMKHPVMGLDGVSYEKRAIIDWLEKHNYSPVTRQPMSSDDLRYDSKRKARIREWKLEKHNQREKLVRTAEKSPNNILGDVQC